MNTINTNKLNYINKLEKENKLLREENTKLKRTFLSDCETYNISLLQKNKQIYNLEREVQMLRQRNAMLVLMNDQ